MPTSPNPVKVEVPMIGGQQISISVGTSLSAAKVIDLSTTRVSGIVITAKSGSPTTLTINVGADGTAAANLAPLASGPITVSSLPIAYALADDINKFNQMALTVDSGTITVDINTKS